MELNLDWSTEDSTLLTGVRYSMRPLKVWAFQELMGCWEQAASTPHAEGGPPPLRLGSAAGAALMPLLRRIFTEHVRGLEGLSLRAGGNTRAATVEDLCEEAALLPLAGELLTRLLARSDLSPGDEKN